MSDILRPISIKNILYHIVKEFKDTGAIYGIKPYHLKKEVKGINIFGENTDLPLGPAAGPHTQLAENIVATYVAGSRYFELKTVQILDSLELDKPCIDAEDEGYNTEWSTELSIKDAYIEYAKAWIILHLMNKLFSSRSDSFIFNMSVGYDLKGIMSEKVDWFINNMMDSSKNEFFKSMIDSTIELIKTGLFGEISDIAQEELITAVKEISPKICSTIALSTMHGCPPEEIEDIIKYLLQTKNLNVFVKLNPTLLGYDFVRNTLDNAGFEEIELNKNSFENDLQFERAIKLIKNLKLFAKKEERFFGVKLSNTLEVKNFKQSLSGDAMYMSGNSLLPLTISLAHKLAEEFNGDLNISYSGGANLENAHKILSAGIKPITLCTDILKPGGYKRLGKIADNMNEILDTVTQKINAPALKELAQDILSNKIERKKVKKADIKLPLFDCISCNFCVDVCPNRANINIALEIDGLKKKTQIVHLDGLCNECGNCATFCPHKNGKPFEDKLTIFVDKTDFENSKNMGFYLENGNAKIRTPKDGKLFSQISNAAKIIKDNYDYLLKND